MNVLSKTVKNLQELATVHKAVLIAYSGGKDSLVVLDLAVKTFKKVVCYFQYLVPGLGYCEERIAFAKKRYNVEVLQYPGWLLFHCLKNGIYCPNYFVLDDIPDFSHSDLDRLIMYDTGINLVLTGMKRNDSLSRRRILSSYKGGDIYHPLSEWNKFDVLAYLKIHNIPIPDTYKAATTGINLSTKSLLWLHDNYPDDFKKLCKWFPYAEAVVYRRQFYGIQ